MVFVIYSSQHVTGKQQYRNNVSSTGGITRIIDCLELTNEDFFLRDMIVLLHDILIFEKRKNYCKKIKSFNYNSCDSVSIKFSSFYTEI